jgi:UDP-glucose 4-epimerase
MTRETAAFSAPDEESSTLRGVGMHRGTGVLVVGGGFLGSHLVAGLAAEGARVTVLTRTRPQDGAAARIAGARTVVSDAADPAAVEHALENVDHVVWCAGGLLPADSNLDPIADVRDALPPLLTMLEALTRRPQVGITFVSSGGTVYGNPTLLPVPESHPTSPLTSHGVTRVAAEHYLALHQDVYGVPVLILRCGNVYGEGQRGDRSQGVIAAALSCVQADHPFSMFGDGSSERDYLYIGDLVDVVCGLLGRRDAPRVVNVGSGCGATVADIVAIVESVTGESLTLDARPARPGDVSRVVLDTSLLQSLEPFDPLPLHDGIALTWTALVEGEFAPR